MASVIASQALDRAQGLHAGVLALGVVVDLYLSSSGKNIDDMIFLFDYLVEPLKQQAEDLVKMLREEGIDAA